MKASYDVCGTFCDCFLCYFEEWQKAAAVLFVYISGHYEYYVSIFALGSDLSRVYWRIGIYYLDSSLEQMAVQIFR